jgi:23S rRNA (guanosine2251-2'-O)-methyltransferase
VAISYAQLRDLLEADVLGKDARGSRLLVFLDGVEDPHNLGAILRSAEAAGARAVVVPARRSAHVTAAVVRASAGAALLLPTCVVPNLAEALRASRQAGFWLVGLDPAASEPLMPAPAGQPVGLVIGGEGPGLRRLVAERCDTLAHLPMRGSVGSLNASVAAAVGIYRLCQADLYR